MRRTNAEILSDSSVKQSCICSCSAETDVKTAGEQVSVPAGLQRSACAFLLKLRPIIHWFSFPFLWQDTDGFSKASCPPSANLNAAAVETTCCAGGTDVRLCREPAWLGSGCHDPLLCLCCSPLELFWWDKRCFYLQIQNLCSIVELLVNSLMSQKLC